MEKKQDEIDIDKIYDEIGEQNKKSIDEALKNIPRPTIEENQNYERLGCSFCQKSLAFPDDFTCKFCNLKFCIEHIQLEKHDCVKTKPVKHLRKKWLRRYGLNISSGKFKAVCDNCSFNSNSSLIDVAESARTNHIKVSGCPEETVFLEAESEEDTQLPPQPEVSQSNTGTDFDWMNNALEEAKKIIITYHNDESDFLNNSKFPIHIQTDKPNAYGYIGGTSGMYPIGIHETISEKTEENYRIVKIVLVHELLHAIHHDWTENQVSQEERKLANLAGHFDALHNMELLYLSGKMRLCNR